MDTRLLTPNVVVSGIGALGPYGCGIESLATALRDGALSLTAVDRSAGYHRHQGALTAALVTANLSDWVKPATARRMSALSKYALVAARMAIKESRIAPATDDRQKTAVVMSTTFGPVDFTERLFRSILQDGPTTASPFYFTESVANASAAQIAIDCKATGPNITIVQREAGPLLAIARAAAEVREGRAGRALAGTVDEIPPILHAILDRMGALVRRSESEPEIPRPFDRCRDGLIAAEGAVVVILEPEESAAARGARILARVRAAGSAFDPTASRTGWGRGEDALGEALAAVLARASLAPMDVDCIVSGASGTRAGDRLEALTLRRVWKGRELPPVVVPNGTTGEYGGGLLAASVLAAAGYPFGPCPGFREPDPELGLVPHDGRRFPSPRIVLVSTLASGGAGAWLVLEAP